jgi:3-methyladenine DNA glycosylase/8-oxoguanine DNA glycosylase
MAARTIEVESRADPLRRVASAAWTTARDATDVWWATRTPHGPASLRLRPVAPTRVEADAWGPGTDWVLDQAPRLLGHDDDLTGWRPSGPIERLWRRFPDPLPRTDRPWEAVVAAVLGQKVQATLARRSFRAIARRLGEPAPGPCPLWILPGPETVAATGYARLHPLGVERVRADTLRRVATELARLTPATLSSGPALSQRLLAIRGVGPWTVALVAAEAQGDPDAVPVGDFHVPNLVCWALAGEPRGDDARMLELLAPWAGHRGRVIRLLKTAGIAAPRYGPRLSLVAGGLHRGR